MSQPHFLCTYLNFDNFFRKHFNFTNEAIFFRLTKINIYIFLTNFYVTFTVSKNEVNNSRLR